MAGAILLLPMLVSAPARADTVIYRSQGNGYGWSTASPLDRAREQARRNCEARDTACEPVIECHEGWAAVARSDPAIQGFGAACGMSSLHLARVVALAKCMEASNALCRTSDAFDRTTTLSADSNLKFDRAFLAQAMLQIIGYDIGDADGELGPKTRAAIEAFEADIGRSPTGELDDQLLLRLFHAVAGGQRLAAKLKQTVLDPYEATLRRLAYGFAKSPAASVNFSTLVAAQSVEERRMVLAIMLSANSEFRCTPPALSAELVGAASGGTWLIGCSEGSYQLTISDAGTMTFVALGGAPNPGSQPSSQPPSGSNYSMELAARPAGERLMELARLIAANNKKCTPPALSAEPFGDASVGVWNVRCADGSYQVVLLDNGASVVTDWTPLEETGAKPAPDTQPEFNPDPMAALAEPDLTTARTNELIEQMKTLTDGYEYYGQVYSNEIVRNVGYVPSEGLLVFEIDDVRDPDPAVAIIPLKIVDVVSDEFGVGEPAIFFRCDPACITIAFGTAPFVVEKLSTGRANELDEPEQRSEFAFGCDLARCYDLENAIDLLVEFARRS